MVRHGNNYVRSLTKGIIEHVRFYSAGPHLTMNNSTTFCQLLLFYSLASGEDS